MVDRYLLLFLALLWLLVLRPFAGKHLADEEGGSPPMFVLIANILAAALILQFVFVEGLVRFTSHSRVPLP